MTTRAEGRDRRRWIEAFAQADRHWAIQHRATPLPPDRIEFVARACASVHRDLELELANRTALLRRLVEAVTGEIEPTVTLEAQAQEALRVVRRIEQYLLSLQPEQEVA